MLLVAPVPRTARSRIPVLGRVIDDRFEIAFQAAFDRAERAILEAAERSGETVVYTYSFQRRPGAGGGGGSDAEALRAAEADATAKERWLADLKRSAA
ncbi:hypothetical protein [Methylobacterium radiotolerans]